MRKGGGGTSFLEHLCRAVLRLHPPGFRRQHGREMARTLEESLRGESRSRPRRALLLRYLWDTLLTLPRSWLRELRGWSGTAGAPRPATRPSRDPWPAVLLHQAGQAVKGLRRRRLYATVVVGTLALALGANTAIFSVTHAVLLRPLSYDSPERVVRAEPAPIGGRGAMTWGIHPDFLESPLVESAAIFLADGGANLVEGASASRVRVAQVEPAFFRVMGIDLALGPGMTDPPEAGPEAVVGYALWVRAFGGDPGVLGRSLTLSGRSYRVVGIAPRDVTYPVGTELWLSPPPAMSFFGGAVGPRVVVRLTPGVRPEELRPILEERRRQQYAGAPASLVPPPVEVVPVLDELTGPVRAPLAVLAATAGVLLLLGCLNLASLALSRVSDGLEDLRVRHALGASRSRIFGELLAELLLLSLVGGAVGLAVARAGVRVLVGWLPADVPGMDTVELSGPVLLFGLAATLVSALVAGVLPALRGAVVGSAPRRARGVTGDVTGGRIQTRLLAGQVALAVVLSVGAGLLGRSLERLTSVPLGYDTRDVLAFRVQLEAEESDDEAWRSYTSEVIRRVEALPGVSAVGATSRLPFTPGLGRGTDVRSSPDAEPTGASLVDASPGYFQAMGIPILEGTPFSAGEPPGGEDDVILSASLAGALFGDQPAAGRTVWVPRGREEWEERRVRGVVGDVKLRGRLMSGWETVMYGDLRRAPVWFPGFAVRTTADPSAMRERIRDVLAGVDPTVPPFRLQTVEDLTSGELASRRTAASLASLFGVAALLLVAVGLYGTLAHWVARRRREIGVRLALGARSSVVAGRVLWRGLLPTLGGLVLGLAAAVALSRYVEALLYEVLPRDPATYAAVAATIVLVAVLAGWLPARRAAGLDPADSLRAE